MMTFLLAKALIQDPTMIFFVVLLIVLFETEVLESGVMVEDKQSEFLLTFVMELVSLGAAFLGLRLFKFKTVRARRRP